jgi:DNA-binding LacI/PurR family transcriptional regulator
MRKKSKTEQLHEKLSHDISKMTTGQQMMSVRQMMQQFSVSQFTVCQALDRLEQEGRISREAGIGIFARDLKTIDTIRLGLVMPDTSSQIFIEIESMFEQEEEKYDVMISKYIYPISTDISLSIPYNKFDAIAVFPSSSALSPEILKRFDDAPIPVIYVGVPFCGVYTNWVSGDAFTIGVLAASFLISKGHKKMAILDSEPDSIIMNKRMNGFKTIAETNNLTVEIIDCDVQPGEYSPEVTYEKLCKYIEKKNNNFTAMFALSDETALAAIRAFNKYDINVPDDISLIGADGIRQSNFYTPSLTTIATDYRVMANKVMQTAVKACKDEHHVVDITIKPYVIERTSVKDIN